MAYPIAPITSPDSETHVSTLLKIVPSTMMTTPPTQASLILTPSTQTHLAPQHPLQSHFNDDKQGFLRTFLLTCHEYYQMLAKQGTGKWGVKGTKGKKRNWVLDNVYPAFTKQFNSAGPNGPNIVSLKDVSTLLSAMVICWDFAENSRLVSKPYLFQGLYWSPVFSQKATSNWWHWHVRAEIQGQHHEEVCG